MKVLVENCQSYNLSICECISNHGTQFYADKRDWHGFVNHSFERFLKEGVYGRFCAKLSFSG